VRPAVPPGGDHHPVQVLGRVEEDVRIAPVAEFVARRVGQQDRVVHGVAGERDEVRTGRAADRLRVLRAGQRAGVEEVEDAVAFDDRAGPRRALVGIDGDRNRRFGPRHEVARVPVQPRRVVRRRAQEEEMVIAVVRERDRVSDGNAGRRTSEQRHGWLLGHRRSCNQGGRNDGSDAFESVAG